MLQLIIGPMFSGKTTELIRRYERVKVAKRTALMVKYQGDSRYSLCNVTTHCGQSIDAHSCTRLDELADLTNQHEVVCIDEVQFYPDAVETIRGLIESGKTVIAAGLNGTSNREPFPVVARLISLATKLDFCTSVCYYCKSEQGCFSKRLTNESDTVVIGGADKYHACCLNCWAQPPPEKRIV